MNAEAQAGADPKLWDSLLARAWHPSQWFYDHRPPPGKGASGSRGHGAAGRTCTMWVYKLADKDGVYIVGYYTPDKEWVPESVHNSERDAATRVHWLNGGNVE